MRIKTVKASELRVGDILQWYNARTKIIQLTIDRDRIIVFTDWDPRPGMTITSQWFQTNTVIAVIEATPPRACAPCRDSDCECIFDEVG